MRRQHRQNSRIAKKFLLKNAGTTIVFITVFYFGLGTCAVAQECPKEKHLSPSAAEVSFEEGTEINLRGPVTALAWSSDSQKFVAASMLGDLLSVITRDGKITGQIKSGSAALFDSIGFLNNPDRILFASPAKLTDRYFVSEWMAAGGDPVLNMPHPGASVPIAVSPDQKLLATAYGRHGGVTLYRTDDGAMVKALDAPYSAFVIRFTHRGDRVVIGTATGSIVAFDIKAEKFTELGSPFELIQSHNGFVRGIVASLSISPCDDVAFAGVGLMTSGLNIAPGTVISELPDEQEALSFMKNLDRAVLIGLNGQHSIVAFPGRAEGEIPAAAWDPLGRFIVFSDNRYHLHFWYPNGKDIKYKTYKSDTYISSIAISPDGSSIAMTAKDGVKILHIKYHGGTP